MKKILFVGGAGYVGSVLTPKLLALGYHVTVLDLMIFGNNFNYTHDNLTIVKGDINDSELLKSLLKDKRHIVINFAVVTDGTGEPKLDRIRKESNVDACINLARLARKYEVNRFIYSSSTSVYGNVLINDRIDESFTPTPLTDYGRFKRECELGLLPLSDSEFAVTCIRPCTVFGPSLRARFDLLVNNLTMTAHETGKVILAGAEYNRPNIHIQDLTDFYLKLIQAPMKLVEGQIFNVVDNNLTIEETALKIINTIKQSVEIEYVSAKDHRSYVVSSDKAFKLLDFSPKNRIEDAVRDLIKGLENGIYDNPMTNKIYYNKYKPGYIV